MIESTDRVVANGPRTAFPLARRVVVLTSALAVFVSVFSGCTPNDTNLNAFIHDWEAIVSASDYHVIPPDAIEISSANAPEIDGEVQTVRQDGKVSLRLIGEVKVAGLTPLEIGRKLESLLAKYYHDPQVSVRVSGNGSKKYYVFGQVGGGGVGGAGAGGGAGGGGGFTYTGRDTVLTALAKSPPNFLAWRSQVKIIRPSHKEGERSVITVDIDKILFEGRLAQNVHLQEGDIIYVPPTPLAWVGLRLQEILFPFAPILQAVGMPANVITSVDHYDSNDD